MAQIRQAVTEYAILPLGSEQCKAKTQQIKSLLLYGPKGSGKTLMAEAIANETGAIFMNLSPSNLAGKFQGKTGPTKLMHMAFTVARDPSMAPAVIYIDECDQMLAKGAGKGKKAKSAGGDEGPARFKKDLLTYAGNALGLEHRVIIIGCSSEPQGGDPKDIKSLFDKKLYLPKPDYASRVMIWQKAIMEALTLGSSEWSGNHPSYLPTGWRDEPGARPEFVPVHLDDEFDLSTLAHISEGYTAGSIRKAVKQTLTKRRVDRLGKRELKEKEFVSALSRCPVNYQEDDLKYRDFTAEITGLKETRDRIFAKKNEGEGGGDDKKKGKKKKK